VPGRRILITGVANFFGARLAARLAEDPHVERVVGLDTRPPGLLLRARITFIEADLRTPELGAHLRAAAVDTLVHNDISQFPEPGRAARDLHDINVVGTLRLLAAAGALPGLRTVVVRSSAAIYGSEPSAPSFIAEDQARRAPLRTPFQRDVGELERLVEGFARRSPEVTCSVLRLQPVVGPTLDTPITRLLRVPVVPTVLGFDPRIQLLDEDDAIAALQRAVALPVPGPVNVAADGPVSLSRALRRLHRRSLPIAHPVYAQVAGALARAGGLPPLSEDILRYLRYGRTIDTTRMTGELGFVPQRSTLAALERAAGITAQVPA
jgi:UDP-glucose 4-epimerase